MEKSTYAGHVAENAHVCPESIRDLGGLCCGREGSTNHISGQDQLTFRMRGRHTPPTKESSNLIVSSCRNTM
jgi:hypothetical protein